MTAPGASSPAEATIALRGQLVAVCVSSRKGRQKVAVAGAVSALRGRGIEGDAHAGNWHRQVSLLADERIDGMRQQGLELAPGDFGENLVTRGVDLDRLVVGRRFRVGEAVVLQATQHGKQCHDRCAIYQRTGDCIMPRHGLFARVLRGGPLAAGQVLTTDPDLDRLRYAVVPLSDRRSRDDAELADPADDPAGDAACSLLEQGLAGAALVQRSILADEREALERELVRLCDDLVCDLVVTTGGTGLSPRDVTPEATLAVIDRQVPGVAEAMRAVGLAHTPHAMLSRAVCGQRGATIVLNLLGSPRAVAEQLAVVLPALPHALQVASGIPQDCGR